MSTLRLTGLLHHLDPFSHFLEMVLVDVKLNLFRIRSMWTFVVQREGGDTPSEKLVPTLRSKKFRRAESVFFEDIFYTCRADSPKMSTSNVTQRSTPRSTGSLTLFISFSFFSRNVRIGVKSTLFRIGSMWTFVVQREGGDTPSEILSPKFLEQKISNGGVSIFGKFIFIHDDRTHQKCLPRIQHKCLLLDSSAS